MTQEELLFFDGRPSALALYLRLREVFLSRHPEAQVRVRKTQIGFAAPLLCVIVWLPRRKADRDRLQVSFTLPWQALSPRIAMTVEPYPNRVTHHLLLSAPDELDDELISWLDAAAAFAKRGR